MNCLSVFNHFAGLAHRGLRIQDFTRLVIVPQVLHSILKMYNTELDVFFCRCYNVLQSNVPLLRD